MVYRCGDLLGFRGRSLLSRVIRAATLGPYSHVAVVGMHSKDHRLIAYESTSQSPRPCLIEGESVSGVQCHEIADLLSDHGHGWHFPLNTPLDLIEGRLLSAWLIDRLGAGYDYSDAIAARTAGFGWLRNLVDRWCQCASDDADIICSDLVASALHSVNRYPQRWGHVSPSGLIRELLNCGTISPGRKVK